MRKSVKGILVVGLVAVLALSGARAVVAQGPGDDGAWGRCFANVRGRFADGREAMADLLGLSVEEMGEQLRSGASLADLARDRDVDLVDLRNASESARREARIEQIEGAVADGVLERAHADWILEGVEQDYTDMPQARRFGWYAVGRSVQEATAEALGLSVEDLELHLWAGETLADLAEEADVDLGAVLEARDKARQEALLARIDRAAEEGVIDADQAAWLREGVAQGYLGEHALRGARGSRGITSRFGIRGRRMPRGRPSFAK